MVDVPALAGGVGELQQRLAPVDHQMRGRVDGGAGEERPERDAVSEGAGDGEGGGELDGGVGADVPAGGGPAQDAGLVDGDVGVDGVGVVGERGAVGVDVVVAVQALEAGVVAGLDPVVAQRVDGVEDAEEGAEEGQALGGAGR
ncbi:hypothetical protein ACIQNV_37500 [Streptomyces hydrogenans]|uniref:hypothetical protein n=1 Tax=Streptomyces hydrogenans TaxID=1873719 RepID=UPI00380A649D